MNAAVVVADLETAREALGRALDRATALAVGAGLADGEAIAADLRFVRHVLDRAMNELREG